MKWTTAFQLYIYICGSVSHAVDTPDPEQCVTVYMDSVRNHHRRILHSVISDNCAAYATDIYKFITTEECLEDIVQSIPKYPLYANATVKPENETTLEGSGVVSVSVTNVIDATPIPPSLLGRPMISSLVPDSNILCGLPGLTWETVEGHPIHELHTVAATYETVTDVWVGKPQFGVTSARVGQAQVGVTSAWPGPLICFDEQKDAFVLVGLQVPGTAYEKEKKFRPLPVSFTLKRNDK